MQTVPMGKAERRHLSSASPNESRPQGERSLKSLFRRHPWLVSTLALATLLSLVFAVRFTIGVAYWTSHQKEPVQSWMTVRYVGKSWGLSPRTINTEAGLPELVRGHPQTFSEIARQRGVPVEEVIHEVEAAVASLKGESP